LKIAVAPVYSSIAAILTSILALIAGNAMLNTLIPLSGKLHGFSGLSLGLLGSVFFGGMLAGTLLCPLIIQRVGHVKAYAIFCALAIIAAVSYPARIDPLWWMFLRAIIGFAFAGLFNVIDGWIQGKADNASRGRISAINQIVHFTAAAIGQQLVPLGDPVGYGLFSLAAVLFSLSIIPFSLSRTPPPEAPSTVSLQLGWLMRTAPVSAIASLAVGTANGTFWSMTSVFGAEVGYSTREIATFLTATTFGSALAIFPLGRLSDRMDRRRVIVIAGALSLIAEIALALSGKQTEAVFALLGFCIGLGAMNIYPIAMAHANDRAEQGRRVALASTLLFLYCVGAIVGPTIAAAMMSARSPNALYGFMAFVHALLLIATIARIRMRPPPVRAPTEPPRPL
jgi:MFS family permease